jgi:hypothetical protein
LLAPRLLFQPGRHPSVPLVGKMRLFERASPPAEQTGLGTGSAWSMNLRQKNLAGVDPKAPPAGRGPQRRQFLERCSSSPAGQSQLNDGIDQSTTKAPTAIMESTAFATSSAGQGITLTDGEGGGGPG